MSEPNNTNERGANCYQAHHLLIAALQSDSIQVANILHCVSPDNALNIKQVEIPTTTIFYSLKRLDKIKPDYGHFMDLKTLYSGEGI